MKFTETSVSSKQQEKHFISSSSSTEQDKCIIEMETRLQEATVSINNLVAGITSEGAESVTIY